MKFSLYVGRVERRDAGTETFYDHIFVDGDRQDDAEDVYLVITDVKPQWAEGDRVTMEVSE